MIKSRQNFYNSTDTFFFLFKPYELLIFIQYTKKSTFENHNFRLLGPQKFLSNFLCSIYSKFVYLLVWREIVKEITSQPLLADFVNGLKILTNHLMPSNLSVLTKGLWNSNATMDNLESYNGHPMQTHPTLSIIR